MTTRAAIIAEAREWIGTRWQHQAALKGVACDCIGLIAGTARNCGVREATAFLADIRFRSYGRQPEQEMLRLALAEYLDPVSSPRAGDVAFMLVPRSVVPQHFGILSAPDYMIHAYAQARKVVEHRLDEAWRARIVSYHAFRGLS